ncbi:MAG: hypothetical protein K9N35_12310 [Candidatus Marinimicrobia bacterium]|nr:hypothetical protein [Candidatus Neomarinimicrobiota bacterium]
MTKIKILLSSSPKLLSDVIRRLLEDQPDMQIIGEVSDPLQLLITTQDAFADAVIITPVKSNGIPRICNQLLVEHPLLKIITLDTDSDSAFYYRLNHKRLKFQAPSGFAILSILRGDSIPPVD